MIGHFSKGKTTLLHSLKGNSTSSSSSNFDTRIRRVGVNSQVLSPTGKLLLAILFLLCVFLLLVFFLFLLVFKMILLVFLLFFGVCYWFLFVFCSFSCNSPH